MVHRLLSSRHPVSLVGKIYLGASLVLLFGGIALTAITLNENETWVEILVWIPQFDLVEPLRRVRYETKVSTLMAGWTVAVATWLVLAVRLPFRVRAAARTQRRIRELEREVLELRTLPLRQHEEDEILAAEAHLDTSSTRKVMTEKIRLDRARKAGDSGTHGAVRPPGGGGG